MNNLINLLGPLAGLIRETSVYDSVAKVLTVAAGIIGGLDADREGMDDLVAGGLLAIADAVAAYGQQDNNEHGNIIDGIIAGLQRYRSEMVAQGRIVKINH